MKLVSFQRKDGSAGVGVAREEDRIFDLAAAKPGFPQTMTELLAGGPPLLESAQGLLAKAGDFPKAVLGAGDYRLLPAVPHPPKFILCGINYKPHVLEMGRTIPEKPSLFGRFSQTLIAAGDPILVPKSSSQVDWEGEFVAVIGRGGKYISRGEAMNHIAGFTCFNDISVRDFQRNMPLLTLGKNFDSSGPLGPWIVTRDEVPDPGNLRLTTRVNGQVMQEGNTGELIFDLPYLIELISSAMTLVPGDLISTGTPSGVGAAREPPVFLKAGDTVSVSIEGVGELSNPVEAER